MGTYQVLARTWRPQNFEQLIGQRHVAQTLTNSIASGRLAHAYLFSGLRGTGKTTVARILAKCLNCESGPCAKPCDTCDACREIAESRAIDVLEIDAASRTKVEQTRELLEMISYSPVRDRNKILIIDEAHMLSKASFNALLKTLEEPPPNVVFVLATTELQKILPTILSRCQVFEFRRVSSREVAEHLGRICKEEKITISDSSLDRIARAGEGSVRDSLSVLERVLAFCGNDVPDGDVLRMLGAVNANVLAETLRSLSARDAGGMLRVLDSLVDEGHDLLHFWNQLIAALRDLLFLGAVPDRADLLSRPPEEAALLKEAAGDLSREDLTRSFQILADLEMSLKNSSQPRFMFEATLIRLASLGSVRPIEEILQSVAAGGTDGSELTARPTAQKKSLTDALSPARKPLAVETKQPPSARPPAPKVTRPVQPPAAPVKDATPVKDVGDVRPPRAEVAPPQPPPEVAAPPASSPAPRSGSASLPDQLKKRVQGARPMLGAILGQASRIALRESDLLIQFSDEHAAMAQPLMRDDGLDLLRKHAGEIAGRPVQVRISVGGDAPPASPGEALPTEKAPAPAQSRISKSDLIERAKQDPGVKKLLREFGAQVLEIRPMAIEVEHEPLEES